MNLPIALTLFRIVAVPPIMVFLISSSRVSVLIAAVIFVTASLTDWLDGRMARRWNQVTKLGTLLDPVADKLLVAAALISLVHIDMISAWMAVVIIGRELAVTGLRGIALSMGVVVPASSLGKAKTVSQYVALTLLILEKGVSADVALFHLVARARLDRIDWLGDTSSKALSEAHGLMVNYRYEIKDIEKNHEAYANEGVVAASRQVYGLLKTERARPEARKLLQITGLRPVKAGEGQE